MPGDDPAASRGGAPTRVVLFHSHFATIGGAELLLATHARWLAAAGHDVRVVSFEVNAGFARQELAGFRVVEIGYPPDTPRFETMMPSAIPALVDRARPALQDTDVVMAYNYPCAPVAAAAAVSARRVWYACEPFRALHMREGNPVTAARADRVGVRAPDLPTAQLARRMWRARARRALMPWTGAREDALRAFDREGVLAMDAVASLSRYGAACVAEATGRTGADVIYPMVRFPASSPPRRGLRRDAPALLVQTRIAVPKNLDTLITAVALVRRRYPGTTLHVVGSGGGRERLERLIARTMPGAVRFHGYLTEEALERLAAACDIFAFAPADEPFGMVYPESAARGLLLVGSDHGGPREILEDGAIGELCDPFEPASVAEAILRTLALSDTDADRRRERADASVRARFSPDVIGRQLERFLRG